MSTADRPVRAATAPLAAPPRWRRALAATAIALCVLAAAGCTVRLISDYDETIDLSATQLQRDMDSYLTQLQTETGESVTYGANRQFYPSYATDVRAVMIRAQAHPKNERSVAQYELMLDSLAELEAAHMGEEDQVDAGTIPPEAIPAFRDLFNQSWGAIIRLEVAKKR